MTSTLNEIARNPPIALHRVTTRIARPRAHAHRARVMHSVLVIRNAFRSMLAMRKLRASKHRAETPSAPSHSGVDYPLSKARLPGRNIPSYSFSARATIIRRYADDATNPVQILDEAGRDD